MAVAFVEIGEHAEGDREHHGTVGAAEPVGGDPVMPLRLGEVAVDHREERS